MSQEKKKAPKMNRGGALKEEVKTNLLFQPTNGFNCHSGNKHEAFLCILLAPESKGLITAQNSLQILSWWQNELRGA